MNQKKFVSLLFAAGLLSGAAQANNLITQMDTPSQFSIHTLKVTNTGNRNVSGQLVYHLGVLHNQTCAYVSTISAGNYHFAAKSASVLAVDGNALAHAHGMGYSCMDMTLQTDKQLSHDTFWLYNNGQTYTSSLPNYDEVYVN